MAADSSGPDPKALWKDQEQEADAVTLDQVHAMIRRYERRTQRVIVIFPLLLLIAGIVGGQRWERSHDVLGRAEAVIFILGEVGACFLIWRMLYPMRDAAEPAGAYLRRRLVRRLGYMRGGWMIAVSPILPAVFLGAYLAFKYSPAPLPAKVAPFALFAALMVFAAFRMARGAAKVKAQIEELDRLLKP